MVNFFFNLTLKYNNVKSLELMVEEVREIK